jgi:hypothetical protein
MKRLAYLIPALSLAVVMLASHPAAAATNAVTVVATVNWRGHGQHDGCGGGGL